MKNKLVRWLVIFIRYAILFVILLFLGLSSSSDLDVFNVLFAFFIGNAWAKHNKEMGSLEVEDE